MSGCWNVLSALATASLNDNLHVNAETRHQQLSTGLYNGNGTSGVSVRVRVVVLCFRGMTSCSDTHVGSGRLVECREAVL